MRLLKANGDHFELRNFKDNVPSYAILSHTWGPEASEITFTDFKSDFCLDEAVRNKPGYEKLVFCLNQAKRDGLEYFWVDSCCIDQKNLAELTESLASMFRWYRDAARCYVYLSDVSFDQDGDTYNQHRWEPDFWKSRWFTRGWTLQELLAPRSVEFFSSQRKRLGDKQSLEKQIHEITGVSTGALRGIPLNQFSVEERMGWAEARITTRQEDRAYCLQGIFNVFLSPIYGEEDHAFTRLMDAIDRLKKYPSTREDSPKKRRKVESCTRDSQSNEHNTNADTGKTCHISNKDLIKSLYFEQINHRFINITPGLAKTCNWLFQSPQYADWVDPAKLHEHQGFFWIRGKPGSGKSTLTKFAFQELVETLEASTILSFFFNARGSDLEKSTVGLYRSLLVQLLQTCSPSQLLSLPGLTRPSPDLLSTSSEMLKQILSRELQSPRYQDVTVVIDALDECNEDDIRDMVQFLESTIEEAMSNQRKMRVLLSSRHYPNITIRRCVALTLEDQHGHFQDIEKYLENRLNFKGDQSEIIRAELRDRSSGIFLWIVLVVQILNKAFDRGQVHTLRKKLHEIPNGLDELFRDLLTRDDEDLHIMQLCLQWILYAKRPMQPEELYYAILSGIDSEESLSTSPNTTSTRYIHRFIIHHSKGVAEVTKSNPNTVQFIHESVRDYLLKKNGIGKLWSNLMDNAAGKSHNTLRDCCFKYMGIMSSNLEIPHTLPDEESKGLQALRKDVHGKGPFLEYAVGKMLAHAEDAQSQGLSQERFLEDFGNALCKWASLNNIMEKYQTRRYPIDIDLKYILAERNYPKLLELQLGDAPDGFCSNGRFENLVFAAVAHGRQQILEIFARRDGRVPQHLYPFPVPRDKTFALLLECERPKLVRRFLQIYSVDGLIEAEDGENMLVQAASQGYEDIAKSILDHVVRPNAESGYHSIFSKALIVASTEGYENIVKLLLDRGTDINVQIDGIVASALPARVRNYRQSAEVGTQRDWEWRTALVIAAYKGHTATVKLLLDRGANVNLQVGGKHSSALVAAAWKGRTAIVELLLDGGAKVNAQGDGRFKSALVAAAYGGHVATVRLLLNRGARVNAQVGGEYGSPLLAAAWKGSTAMVELLLDRGAEVNAQVGGKYGSPLVAATWKGSTAIVELLLDQGANVNAQVGGEYGSALVVAASEGSTAIVKLLLDRGAELDAQVSGRYGDSALVAAATAGETGICELLLDHGANIDLRAGADRDDSALISAAEAGHMKVVRLLLDRGADINLQVGGFYGNALVAATYRGRTNIVVLLLNRGADINAGDGKKGTALHVATRAKKPELVELLRTRGATELPYNTSDSDSDDTISIFHMNDHGAAQALHSQNDANST